MGTGPGGCRATCRMEELALRSEKWWLSESLSHCDVGEGREARYSWPGTR